MATNETGALDGLRVPPGPVMPVPGVAISQVQPLTPFFQDMPTRPPGMVVVSSPILITLPAAEAPQQLRTAELHIEHLRAAVLHLQRLALQATQPHMGPEARQALQREAREIVQHILYLSLATQLGNVPLLRPQRLRLEIESPHTTEIGPIPLPIATFEFSEPPLPMMAIQNLDLTTPANALWALQILRREIDPITDFQLALNQARNAIRSGVNEAPQPAVERSPAQIAQDWNRAVLQDIAAQPQSAAAVQAHIEPGQILRLLGI